MTEAKLLYFCDEWKMNSSMSLQGVFNDSDVFHAAIEKSLKENNIEKDCGNECEDCNHCIIRDLPQMSIREINTKFRYLYVEEISLNELM